MKRQIYYVGLLASYVPTFGSSGPVFRKATMSLISLFVPFIFQLPPTKNLRAIFLTRKLCDDRHSDDPPAVTELLSGEPRPFDLHARDKVNEYCQFLPSRLPDSTSHFLPPLYILSLTPFILHGCHFNCIFYVCTTFKYFAPKTEGENRHTLFTLYS